jgi:hypothetical protein
MCIGRCTAPEDSQAHFLAGVCVVLAFMNLLFVIRGGDAPAPAAPIPARRTPLPPDADDGSSAPDDPYREGWDEALDVSADAYADNQRSAD